MTNLVNALRDPALEAYLTKLLDGSRLGRPVYVFARVDSTMDEAHRLAAEGSPEGTLIVALCQERGRGRLGRSWASPEGGLYLSLVLRPAHAAANIPQLSLVTGLAVAEALRDTACVYPAIRWPNDLLVNGRKLGGILTEAKETGVVIGIGINVSTDSAKLPEGSTSLVAEGAARVGREEIAAALCRRLSSWYEVWNAQGFGPIREALRPWLGLFGQPVKLTSGNQQLEGTPQGVDEQGRLVVRLDSGVVHAFDVGEIALLR